MKIKRDENNISECSKCGGSRRTWDGEEYIECDSCPENVVGGYHIENPWDLDIDLEEDDLLDENQEETN